MRTHPCLLMYSNNIKSHAHFELIAFNTPCGLHARPSCACYNPHNRIRIAPQPAILAVGKDGLPLPLATSYLGTPVATDITKKYNVTNVVLGTGAFATTRMCLDKCSGRRLACKSIHKQRLEGLTKDWTDVRREIQVGLHEAGMWAGWWRAGRSLRGAMPRSQQCSSYGLLGFA